jgi:hypothetical protein
MNSTVKKAIKHLLGRDHWSRPVTAKPTRFYRSRYESCKWP